MSLSRSRAIMASVSSRGTIEAHAANRIPSHCPEYGNSRYERDVWSVPITIYRPRPCDAGRIDPAQPAERGEREQPERTARKEVMGMILFWIVFNFIWFIHQLPH